MSLTATISGTLSEGVLTVLPGTQTAARRYTSRDAVPVLDRARAQQIGAAGYWYVPERSLWDILLQPIRNPFGTLAAGAADQETAQQQAKDVAKAAATGAADEAQFTLSKFVAMRVMAVDLADELKYMVIQPVAVESEGFVELTQVEVEHRR